jgi:hypothetical protein
MSLDVALVMSRQLPRLALLLLSATGACGNSAGENSGDSRILEGTTNIWVSTPDVAERVAKFPLEVQGRLLASRTDLTSPPNTGYVYWQTGPSTTRTLVIQADSGRQWLVGYAVRIGLETVDGPAPTDITPDLMRHVGADVHLLVRPGGDYYRSFGLVLKSAGQVLLALERAGDTKALESGDVPGLQVEAGAVVGEQEEACVDYQLTALRFVGDSSIESVGSRPAVISIGGASYEAVALAGFRARAAPTCPDGPSAGRSWAVWLRD